MGRDHPGTLSLARSIAIVFIESSSITHRASERVRLKKEGEGEEIVCFMIARVCAAFMEIISLGIDGEEEEEEEERDAKALF